MTVAHDVPGDMLELAYSGLADLSAEFRVDAFTEFEQTAGGRLGGRPRVPADRPAALTATPQRARRAGPRLGR